ncbi:MULTISPECIES: CCRG-2 family RiPP [unclassified Prochlorococcus]|uniref:CCRG-2 family RiPP n=1 Tax=unclassified Prochlorococcus TaxID=2627481 RepID=UPI000533A4DD|nr:MULTISPECIES: CCRG-2 family RiPP [unclassified Prochlorococcus]KGG28268.1 hypothetical protein EV12_0768 [Prochlorococcus sp. MIT 0701]KGG28999.1 hypothetical protein EV13_1378 [Prochlorococcus sp. MIT 0702]KGG35514.1 hypothetical protein EV14_0807 [Prochlorococcus sp. MIT 0703]
MTNIELTLDQLQTINGGSAFVKLGGIKNQGLRIIHPGLDCAWGSRPGLQNPSDNKLGSSRPGLQNPSDNKLWWQ